MITIASAEKQLASRFGEGIKEVQYVWDVFKEFAKEEVIDEEEKAILFQCGVYNFTGENLFYFDFVRQFTDEVSGIQQLHCEFVFEPIEELKKLEASEWYFESEGEIEDFFKHIECLTEFKLPLNYTPSKLNIYQEQV